MRAKPIIKRVPGVWLFLAASLGLPAHAQLVAAPTALSTAALVDVEFQSGGTVLAGAAVIPPKVLAGVVIVHGSGQEQRNLDFARALAQRGLAALTYDKRGTGKSGGTYVGPELGTNNVDPSNLALLAEDALAAMKALSRRIAPAEVPLGLIGISQAGWIIPIAAARSDEVKFMLIWSGPMVTTLEQLRFQFFTEGKAEFWETHGEADVREHIRTGPDRYQFSPTDPASSLRSLSIPGLWLYGRRDLNVPVGLCIERLASLASTGKRFEYREFADAGHQLPFDAALSASMDWLQRTMAVGPAQAR